MSERSRLGRDPFRAAPKTAPAPKRASGAKRAAAAKPAPAPEPVAAAQSVPAPEPTSVPERTAAPEASPTLEPVLAAATGPGPGASPTPTQEPAPSSAPLSVPEPATSQAPEAMRGAETLPVPEAVPQPVPAPEPLQAPQPVLAAEAGSAPEPAPADSAAQAGPAANPVAVFLGDVLASFLPEPGPHVQVYVAPEAAGLPAEKLSFFGHSLQQLLSPIDLAVILAGRHRTKPLLTDCALSVRLERRGDSSFRLRLYDDGTCFERFFPELSVGCEALRPLRHFLSRQHGSIVLKTGRCVEFEIIASNA